MAVTEERTQTYIGTSVARKEDPKLLTGQASFVDNLSVPGMLWIAVVRSPYAHARINGVDTAAARAHDGVVAAFSGAELREDWQAGLPCAWPVADQIRTPDHWPLAVDKARYA